MGLDLVAQRTLSRRVATVSVVVPAHNEQESVGEVVAQAWAGLDHLGVKGEVVVSASGCVDDTAEVAAEAGARVVTAPVGKGAAVTAGLAATTGDVVCLVDGDLRYFGDPPLVALLVEPIVLGRADACVADLYWRPLYPQLWLNGFFAPLAGVLFPELLAKVGSTPWSGQRAALRALWPQRLPQGFTVDLELLLHWNRHATRLRPVLADDWTNPQRPKPDLMAQEFEVVTRRAVEQGRIENETLPRLRAWFEAAHELMAGYRPGEHDPQAFDRHLLEKSLTELRWRLAGGRVGG
ncbi:MAG TPA: glycosyltransferase [Planosporangium sp.]|nr:glycosyltransferase [Planosporangium sp.]